MTCRRYFCVRRRRSSVLLFVLFLIVIFGLYYLIRNFRNIHTIDKSGVENEAYYFVVLRNHFVVIGEEWRLSSSGNRDTDLNCTSFRMASNKQFIATGWTKETYRARLEDRTVALKYVNPYGHQMETCESKEALSFHDCYMNSASKLLLDVVRLKALEHPNVIKVLGYCIPKVPIITNNDRTVGIMTEYGEPLNVIQLLQMSWPGRVKICLGLSKLLHHLSHSPLGSISLNDFRRQQFVLVQGELKLVDTDYIGTSDPVCNKNECCFASVASDVCIPCVKNICKGYNERLNILNAGKHFIQHLLPYDVPPLFVSATKLIVKAFEKSSWNVSKILNEMEKLSSLTNSMFNISVD